MQPTAYVTCNLCICRCWPARFIVHLCHIQHTASHLCSVLPHRFHKRMLELEIWWREEQEQGRMLDAQSGYGLGVGPACLQNDNQGRVGIAWHIGVNRFNPAPTMLVFAQHAHLTRLSD